MSEPVSLLMSESAACAFLGIDGKGIRRLIAQRRLARTELGNFKRADIQRIHDEVVGMPLASRDNFREVPILS